MKALCVCKCFSLVSGDIRCHIPALPAWRNKPGCLVCSAQAEKDTFILYSTQESVVYENDRHEKGVEEVVYVNRRTRGRSHRHRCQSP